MPSLIHNGGNHLQKNQSYMVLMFHHQEQLIQLGIVQHEDQQLYLGLIYHLPDIDTGMH